MSFTFSMPLPIPVLAPLPMPAPMAVPGLMAIALLLELVLLALLGFAPSARAAAAAQPGDPGELAGVYASVASRLAQSPLKGPVLIESNQHGNQLSGVLMAELANPIAQIAEALGSARTVCELLFLHVYVHACVPSNEGIIVNFGDRDGRPDPAMRVEYRMSLSAPSADTVRLNLHAATGPVTTSDYRIDIEALALGPRRSFVRLTYRYAVGMMGRLAMQAYLNTAGRSKIGFTEEAQGDGAKVPIGGLRGSLERNLMRYHLAMQAWLDGRAAAEPQRLETRLRIWYQLTEQYSRQLHEQSADEYLVAKRRERGP